MKYLILVIAFFVVYIAIGACENRMNSHNLTVDTEHIKMERKGGKIELSSPFPMLARVSGSNQLVEIGKLAVVEYQSGDKQAAVFISQKQDTATVKDAIGNTYFTVDADSLLIVSVKK